MPVYAETFRRVVSSVTQAFSLGVRAVAATLTVPACAACDEPLEAAAIFCAPCATTVLEAPPWEVDVGGHVVRVAAAASHGGAVATAVNRFKHGDRPDLARPLGDLVRHHLRQPTFELPGADVVVPVPLHPVRLAERKYNQAALLARALQPELNLPIRFDVLHRAEPTRPQQGLTRGERAQNLTGAFAVRSVDLRGLQVMLVDDVATTGATLAACAEKLFDAGIAGVSALVITRSEIKAASPGSS